MIPNPLAHTFTDDDEERLGEKFPLNVNAGLEFRAVQRVLERKLAE